MKSVDSRLRWHILVCGLVLSFFAPLGAAHARGFGVLYDFCSVRRCTDGRWSYAGLIADSAGNFYGTTGAGGRANCRLYGCGTVFKLAPDGTETVLHAFSAQYDGSGPYGGLVADASGNLYGTTATGGGTGCGGIDFGCGTVFRIAPGGKETVLYSFAGGSDGAYPSAGLILDAKGNLYGTAEYGGGGMNCLVNFGGCGTVFKLTPKGKESVLYAFTGGSDGANPVASLIADSNGNLFGTASDGGNLGRKCSKLNIPGCGVVFKLAADGTETTLLAFKGGSEGNTPFAGLIEDKNGNLYGNTVGGGNSNCYEGCGVVFKIAPDGGETVLYTFTGGNDGANPAGNLIVDTKGNLYGTTSAGGSSSLGTVFKLAPDDTLSVLHTFAADDKAGSNPVAGLIAGANGELYGTTEFGGPSGDYGIVFKVKK